MTVRRNKYLPPELEISKLREQHCWMMRSDSIEVAEWRRAEEIPELFDLLPFF